MIPRNEETNSEKFMYNSLLSVCGIIPRRQYDTILAEERWFLHKNLVWFHVIGRKQHNGYQLHQAFYFSRGAALGDPQVRSDVTLALLSSGLRKVVQSRKAPTSAFTLKTLLRHYANQPARPF